jgi:hypothetical protein
MTGVEMKILQTLFVALSLGATAVAAEGTLVVNAPEAAGPFENDQTLAIHGASIAKGQLAIFTTTMTFTVPTEDPVYSDVVQAGDKLVIAPSKDGTLWVANNGQWTITSVKITEANPKVKLVAQIKQSATANNRLDFDIYLNDATEPITITAPSEGLSFESLIFEGEGAAEKIAFALAPVTIVPGDEAAAQDATLVSKYVDWLNESTKGGALANDATDGAKMDAFAMNSGANPSLEIVDIDILSNPKTITIKGFYEGASGATTIDWSELNGTLYLTYCETLSGTPEVTEIDFTIDATGCAVVEIPAEAVFMKATVALRKPPAEL